MIASETLNRKASRWPTACVLLGALLVLPVGLDDTQIEYFHNQITQ